MADKEKEAYWKGYNDYKKCGGLANSNPLTEFFHPSYNPPSKHQEAYKGGWERAKQEKDGGGSGGGCFLTTACVEYAGLPDDCYELQTMRKFRDEFVRTLPEGSALLEEYYRVAPMIVQHIKSQEDSHHAFEKLLATLREAVVLIEAGRNSEAVAFCKKEFALLRDRYDRTNTRE